MNRQNYSQRYQRPAWGPNFLETVVGKLILANVVIFFLQAIIPHFNEVFALYPRVAVGKLFVWQVFTYMFMHGSFGHIFFNMFVLLIFGTTLESVWGARAFLRYYLACGVGAGLFSIVFSYNAAVIGASGAIFGLYLAYAVSFPNNYIYLYFVFPVKAKYLVAGMAALQLLQGISGPSGIAYFAHLGGMATGLLFFRDVVERHLRGWLGPRRRWNSQVHKSEPPRGDGDPGNIDSILDKISAKGYENLSTTEKRILENYSRKHRDESQ